MDIKKFQEYCESQSLPAFRSKQVMDFYVTQPARSWNEVSVLPKTLRDSLHDAVPFLTVVFVDSFETDDVIKCVFELVDGGHKVEAVIMKHNDGRRTLCTSCQAGCPMGCYFCATGTMGLKKNLSASEIFDIAREVQMLLKSRGEQITNIVYMGMGEPFANYTATKESLHMLHEYMGIGWRKMSVSTCGIVPKILEFADDFPQVNLAISLHAATNEKRSAMMPINTTYPLEKLMKACEEYVVKTHRKIFFEYLVIDEFNDTKEDAQMLKKLLNHPLYHLNLIRFHKTDAVTVSYGIAWKAPTKKRLDEFMSEIKKARIPYTLRRSFGEQIDAACGMLALKHSKE